MLLSLKMGSRGAILLEYLVALKRERFYCNCGIQAVERTVVNNSKTKQGHKCLFCAAETCGFSQMYPMCDCGCSAEVAVTHKGDAYYHVPQCSVAALSETGTAIFLAHYAAREALQCVSRDIYT